MKRLKYTFAVLFALAFLHGCSGPVVRIADAPATGFTSIGRVEGKACGMLGIVATAYYFIPLMINDRTERAYKDALSKAPGATGLVDVTVNEDWYWIVIGTMRCVTVTGTAVK